MSGEDYLSQDYDPYESPQGRRPSGSSTNWALIIGILAGVGLLFVLLCCGGVFYLVSFGTDVIAEQILIEIEDNPVVVEHIGTIEEFEFDMAKSAAAPGADEYVFRIVGDKGAGFLRVESVTVNADQEEVTDGTLKMDSGETFPLFDKESDEAVDVIEGDESEGALLDESIEPVEETEGTDE